MFEDYLTVSQVAEILNRHPNSVRKSVERGIIKATKHGKVWFIHKDDLKAYQENPPKPGPKTGTKQSGASFRVFEQIDAPHTRIVLNRTKEVEGYRLVFGPDTADACKAFMEESQVAE